MRKGLVIWFVATLCLLLSCSSEYKGGGEVPIPNAPSNLAAVPKGQIINLTWIDNSSREKGFYVYRRVYGTNSFTRIATLEANTTAYTDDLTNQEGVYEYKVTAFNEAGESADSNIAVAMTVPNAPSGLSAEALGQTIELEWTDNSEVENSFYVYRGEYGTGNFTRIATLGSDATSYSDDLTGQEGRAYEYKVTACNDAGESAGSNTAHAQTAPNAPSGLEAEADYSSFVQESIVRLRWQDNSEVESGYKIERRINSGSWMMIATLPANTTGYIDTELDCETDYQYRVYAYNDAVNSNYSNTVSITTLECWSIYTIDSEGEFTSIAIDSNNKVHISYFDYPSLKYATNASGVWEKYTVDSGGYVGKYTSIAIDSNDRVHISYYDDANEDLKYATNASGSWKTYTIDSGGCVGLYTSIAIDSNDRVHISYCDWTNEDLKYATNASGSWETYTIDSGGYVGWDTSITIDSNDRVHISYRDHTNFDLKYATNASGIWKTYTIDSEGNVGWDTSIAIDSNDRVHISYYDGTNDDLKYATNASGIWKTYTIDSEGNVGEYTSIAIDSNDKVHISYDGNDDLKYATNASGNWKVYTVDDVGWDGGYTSIAIDSNGYVHISYDGNGDLKYATNRPPE